MLVSFNMSTHLMDIEESTNRLDHGRTTVNEYATKKTIASGHLEIALLATNAVQLKTFLNQQTTDRQIFWKICFILIVSSLIIQFLNLCLLILIGKDNIDKQRNQHRLLRLNNFSLFLSVFIAMINVVLNIIIAIDPQPLNSTNTTLTIL